MKIISGLSNLKLAQKIANKLNLSIVDCEISNFKNEEKRIWIKENLRSENITLVQSFSSPVDSHIIETLLITDALERMGARHVNLLVPWMGYSLQDKVFREGEPIAAKMVANILSNTYIRRVFLLDLHNNSIPGFFSIPTHHLSAMDIFADYIKENFDLKKAIIASPDFGGLKRARSFANKLGLDLINIDKHRDLKTGKVTAVGLHGKTKNKTVFLFDDVIMSGGTVVESAKILKKEGAKQVHFLATHAVLCDNAIQKIQKSKIDSVVVTNSIYHKKINDRIKTLDVSPIFAEAIKQWL
ncbi:MAG: ribose-phosphate pyrophosphokinase [Candidatus Woesebacteria bacterium]|jgi:ribose-phosphate pyrophosphokinase